MDMASLVPSADFFNEQGPKPKENSVAKAIADWVDSFPEDQAPVIRFLIGDDNPANDHTKTFADEPITNIF